MGAATDAFTTFTEPNINKTFLKGSSSSITVLKGRVKRRVKGAANIIPTPQIKILPSLRPRDSLESTEPQSLTEKAELLRILCMNLEPATECRSSIIYLLAYGQ